MMACDTVWGYYIMSMEQEVSDFVSSSLSVA